MIDFRELWGIFDWLILAIYFVLILGVGAVMHKRASTSFKSFFVASRRLTIPVLIGVAAAGWYDSWTIVGLAECGFTMGISILFIYVIPTALLRLPLAIWIGPYTRDKLPDHVVTLPDMIRHLYDRKTGVLGGVVPVFSVLYSAALLFAVGEVLHLVTGLPIFFTVVVAGLAIIFYTTMAGLWALAVTDLIQFAVMTVSGGALAIGILNHFGSMQNIWDSIAAIDPLLLTPMGHNTPLDVFAWIIGAAALYVNAQSYQRFGASKGGGEIKVAYTLMLTIGIAFSTIMVFGGMTALVMFPEATSPAMGFWATVFTVLPPGMRGLFVAALIAAVMSTSSADILISAGIIAKDIIKEFFMPNMTDQGTVKTTRILIVFVGIFIIMGTFLWSDGIAKAWYYIGGFQTAVFFIPIVCGLFYKRKTATGGFISVVSGIVFYVVWEFILMTPMSIPTNVATWCISIVVYFLVNETLYRKDNPKNI
jgi:SSS family solute:Na+ symporter